MARPGALRKRLLHFIIIFVISGKVVIGGGGWSILMRAVEVFLEGGLQRCAYGAVFARNEGV